MAPLRSLTDDFKRKHQDSKNLNAKKVAEIEKKLDKVITEALNDKHTINQSAHDLKIKSVLDRFHQEHNDLRNELASMVELVEMKCAPKRYAVNTDTNKLHIVLNTFEEVGIQVRAYCGWRFALPRARCRMVGPLEIDGIKRCGTCYDLDAAEDPPA